MPSFGLRLVNGLANVHDADRHRTGLAETPMSLAAGDCLDNADILVATDVHPDPVEVGLNGTAGAGFAPDDTGRFLGQRIRWSSH